MAVLCRGMFLLLDQYRHALQEDQYAFPRGYAEVNADSIENVRRELEEELQAEPSGEIVLLGKVAPDSGLTSRMTEIYLVHVDSYQVS